MHVKRLLLAILLAAGVLGIALAVTFPSEIKSILIKPKTVSFEAQRRQELLDEMPDDMRPFLPIIETQFQEKYGFITDEKKQSILKQLDDPSLLLIQKLDPDLAKNMRKRFMEKKYEEIEFISEFYPLARIGSYRLLVIYADADALQFRPPNGRSAPFAFDGKTLLHLGPDNKNLETILAEQKKPVPALFSPEAFAALVNSAKLDRDAIARHVVKSAEDVRQFRYFPDESAESGFQVDEGALAEVADIIAPPIFSKQGDKEVLVYFALRGWWHAVRELVKVTVVVDEDYSLDIKEELLTNHIFSKVPDVVY